MSATCKPVLFPLVVVGFLIAVAGSIGCANIVPPTGGPRDSLPPVLMFAEPPDSAINYKGNKITLTFNEFVNLENPTENVLISPLPNNIPLIDYKLRNVTVKLRDTLEPNTTYTINFGDAIKDVNEGNILHDFSYVFSTGPQLDDHYIAGRVLLAETGEVDSTLIAILYRNLNDSAVVKEKPRYVARLNGKGNFAFTNLPAGKFALYVVPNSYSRRYDDSTKPFAFAPQPVVADSNRSDIVLYAYAAAKPVVKTVAAAPSKDKQLRYTTSLEGAALDILDSFKIEFNRPVGTFDQSKVQLLTPQLQPYNNMTVVRDTGKTRFVVRHPWTPDTQYKLAIGKDAFADTAGVALAKTDTLNFFTKKEADYGSLKIRFNNLDTSRNPVLQLVQNGQVVITAPLTQRDWYRKLVNPGNYDVRILYDANRNGVWDAGSFFGIRRQPEVVVDLDITIDVRANWDNEKIINLAGGNKEN